MLKKHILAFMIAITLITPMANAETQNNVVATNFEKEIQFVTTINIMKNDDSGDFKPDLEINRGEFAEYIIKLMGISESEVKDVKKKIITLDDVPDYIEEPFFSDVPTTDKYYFYIKAAKNLGLMDGYTDGTFGAKDPVKYQQAMKALVSVLGYDLKAVIKGGYPSGYNAIAVEIGLLKGTNFSLDDIMKRGILAKLIYNALHIDIMTQISFGENPEFSVQKDKTILTERLSIKTYKGQVTGNENTRLFNPISKVNENEVEIDGVVFHIGSTDAMNWLGYLVKYYYTEDENGDNKTLVEIFPESNKNETIEVKYEDILSCDLSQFEYWIDEEQSNKKETKLSPSLDVLFNGVALANPTSDTFNIFNGNVVLLDVENDGVFDVCYINTYVNYVVDSVDVYDLVIYDKNRQLPLNLNTSNRTLKYSIIKDDKEIGIEDLEEYDVLSISADRTNKITAPSGKKFETIDTINSTYYKIEVLKNSIDGKVTEINDDEYTIGDKTYKISNSYLRASEYAPIYARPIVLSSEGTFYLDKENNIAATKLNSGSSKNYAYLFGIAKKSAIASDVEVKLLNSDSRVLIYKLAKKVEENGSIIDDDEALDHAVIMSEVAQYGVRKLINYDFNSKGEICELNTATDKSANLETYVGYDETNFSKDFVGSGIAYRSGKLFNLRYVLNNNTVIFLKPTVFSGNNDEFMAAKSTFLSFDNNYDIELYDVNKDFTVGAIVVTAPTNISFTMNSSPVALIDRATKIIDEKGEETTKLTFIKDGKTQQTVISKDNSILYNKNCLWWTESKKVTELKRGDIIQYSTDVDGKLDNLRVLFSPNNLPTPYFHKENANQKDGKDTGNSMASYPAIYAAYGRVMSINPGFSILFNAYDISNNKYNRTLLTSGANVYLYDSDNDTISITSSVSIVEGANIFVRVNGTAVREIIIIK